MVNANLSEQLAVVATIDPQLLDDGAATSDWVKLDDGFRLMFVVNVGATDITVDAKLQWATDGSGTGAADITGRAITQLAATDDNKQVILEIKADELTGSFTHVACVVTAGDGTAGAYVSAVGLLGDLRYLPATSYDLATVVQIKAPA